MSMLALHDWDIYAEHAGDAKFGTHAAGVLMTYAWDGAPSVSRKKEDNVPL